MARHCVAENVWLPHSKRQTYFITYARLILLQEPALASRKKGNRRRAKSRHYFNRSLHFLLGKQRLEKYSGVLHCERSADGYGFLLFAHLRLAKVGSHVSERTHTPPRLILFFPSLLQFSTLLGDRDFSF
jgi:hypothetical protein